jgi:DNA primase
MLKRHSQRIIVNFDPDAAGANAAERSINLLLEEGMQVRIMELDGGLDPDEYCKERGAGSYAERLDRANGYFHWLADRARARHDVRTTEGQVAVLKSLMPAVQRISDRMERMVVAGDVAGYLGIDRSVVLDEFKKAVSERSQKPFQPPRIALRHDERMLLNALLSEPELREEIVPELRSFEAIGTFTSRRIFQTIFTLSDAGGRLRFEEVNSRLEEADQNLFAQAVLGEDMQSSREEVLAAVESMRRSEGQRHRKDLKTRIKEMERAGNWNDALQLMQELQEIERAARGLK